jgi:hypothetical protein
VFSLAGNPRCRSVKPCGVTSNVSGVAPSGICERWPGISRRRASFTSRQPLLVGEALHCPIHGNNAYGAFLVSLGSCWYLRLRWWGIRAPDGHVRRRWPPRVVCATVREAVGWTTSLDPALTIEIRGWGNLCTTKPCP